MTTWTILRDEAAYNAAQARAWKLARSRPAIGSPASDELELLGVLVGDYDARHHPPAPADPIAAIEFAMDQRSLTRKDLEPYLGAKSRISELFAGKRQLTIEQIRRLHEGLRIPLESLIAPRPRRPVAKTAVRRGRPGRASGTPAKRSS